MPLFSKGLSSSSITSRQMQFAYSSEWSLGQVGAIGARNADGHGTQAVEQSCFRPNRPPIVEEDLHRLPHRNPAADHQTFLQQSAQGVSAQDGCTELANQEQRCQHGRPNQKACAPHSEELTKVPAGRLCSMAEVCAYPSALNSQLLNVRKTIMRNGYTRPIHLAR